MNIIPLVPQHTKRVNLAVDLELLNRAEKLRLDVHNFLRLSLQEAIETLEQKEPLYEVTGPETTEAAFLSALVRSDDGNSDEHTQIAPSPYAERIKEAAARAGRRSGT